MTFEDTIKLISSDDYKDRFIAEYVQLTIHINKLAKMLNLWELGKLDFKPTAERKVFEDQLLYMKNYLGTLEKRAITENIKLPSVEM